MINLDKLDISEENNHRSSSVFTRMIILFFLLIIFIYVIGLVVFMTTRQSMVNQYNNALNKQISIYFGSLRDEIVSIRKMQNQLLVDEDLNYLRFRDIKDLDFDMTKSINRVIKQLDSIKNISGNIDIVSVSIPKLHRIYNSTGDKPSYYEDDYFSDTDSLETNPWGIRHAIGDIYISSSGKNVSSSGIAPVFIDTKLSKRSIWNSIKKFNFSDQARSYIIFSSEDCIISDGNKREIDEIKALCVKPNSIGFADVSGERNLIISYYLDFFDATYIQTIPEKIVTKDIDKIKLWYYVFSFAALITLGIFTAYTNYLIRKPIGILVKSLEEVRKHNFQVSIRHKSNNEFAMVYRSFNLMVKRLDKLVNEVYLQKILNQKSELRQLQAQINPHFLYNSFFILKKRISKREYDDAEKFCEMLDKYFYYITKNYKDYSTLQDEVNHAKIYAEIQGIRFSNRIRIEFEQLPQQYGKFVVPKLILQPIIENAFKYGLEDKEFDGLLRVAFKHSGQYIYIIVEDNGEKLISDEGNLDKLKKLFDNHEGIKEISGLLNIHKRIQLFTEDKESGLSFSKSELDGLMVVMKIKFQKELDKEVDVL